MYLDTTMGTNKLKRFARKHNAVLTDDPDGLLSTLQITKRLVTEANKDGQPLSVASALDQALDMSAPKDPVRTWWSALRVIVRNNEPGKSNLAVLADAISNQGTVNARIKKAVAA
ncbi:hypothetical protein SSEA_SKINNY_53 [Mycobacterium phage Skinny]|nr:hypothetical protein [Mycobacterium phage SirSheldon]UXE05256.1 hypothetical protein SSEA_SKINNY_53 [Mycobacterium phage Skinny]WNN95635.1 hypothetical protein SEA_GLASKE16_53 [Mycobacterium phage Glaske16]WNN96284.1 hypothetical protein SEA_DULCITA_53 [Mycobacterium phage Dulcita]WNO28232.1 hypothetical protein SEA_DIMINIMUS_53 [Mycobacterium phage Diminimus]